MYGSGDGRGTLKLHDRVYRSEQVSIKKPYPEHHRDEVWTRVKKPDGRLADVAFSLVDGQPVTRILGFTVDQWMPSLTLVRLSERSRLNLVKVSPKLGQTNFFNDNVPGEKLVALEVEDLCSFDGG